MPVEIRRNPQRGDYFDLIFSRTELVEVLVTFFYQEKKVTRHPGENHRRKKVRCKPPKKTLPLLTPNHLKTLSPTNSSIPDRKTFF
ncbi:MAG: hypothetical protein WCP97_09345 [bacterium]